VHLASLRSDSADGTLIVVNRAGTRFATGTAVARTLQAALDDWERTRPALEELSAAVERDAVGTTPLDPRTLAAPLPRAYEWVDGSAYLSHIALVRRARGVSCLVERRTRELLETGTAKTPYLVPGDRIRIEMRDANGRDIFGSIEQEVVAA
jgi:fumarylacetoacetate (FAA) hydrolase